MANPVLSGRKRLIGSERIFQIEPLADANARAWDLTTVGRLVELVDIHRQVRFRVRKVEVQSILLWAMVQGYARDESRDLGIA